MSIIYIISSLLVLILTILIKKTENKLEITKTILIVLVLKMAYNAFICYVLNLINIPITLLAVSIINIVISIILFIIIVKQKEIQKFEYSKTNIIAFTLITVLAIGIVFINFGGLTKIRYISMDSREHYKAAREFSENTQLSNKAKENNTTVITLMPVGYTNVGLAFKALRPYVGTIGLFKVYVMYEAFVFILIGGMFFSLIEKIINHLNNIEKTLNKKRVINGKILAMIFTIFYLIGYPLNAWISGFHYLLFGLLIVETIIYICLRKELLNFKENIIVFSLLNFGLILSYALYCPFVYLAEYLYLVYKLFIKKQKENNNDNCKRRRIIEIILYTIVAFGIPGIIGITYLIIPTLGRVAYEFAHEGWIYKNYWSSLILFVPFCMYGIWYDIKSKKKRFDLFIFILFIVYFITLFIGNKIGKVSEYYFFKNYYVLWMLLIYFNIKGLIAFLFFQKEKYVANLYTMAYIAVFILMICISKTYILDNAYDNFKQVMQVYTFNNTMMNIKDAAFIKKEELDLLEKADRLNIEWKDQDNLVVITNPNECAWIQALTGYKDQLFNEQEQTIKNLKDNKYKYIITFEDKDNYQSTKNCINIEKLKKLDENEIGKIYVKEVD